MTMTLTGWYEVENGVQLVDETGESLSEIVSKLVERDYDFGYTDMELELHKPDGEVKSVEHLVHRMIRVEH